MACATLKRHVEWDPLAAGPHAMSPRPAKRARRVLGAPFALNTSRQFASRESTASPSVFQEAAPKLTSGEFL